VLLCYPYDEKPKRRLFELLQSQEVGVIRKDIPHAERTYLAVPYAERHEAKTLGARWDAVKKAWYVGPEADREKIAKWN
jgi:hypothetical protein